MSHAYAENEAHFVACDDRKAAWRASQRSNCAITNLVRRFDEQIMIAMQMARHFENDADEGLTLTEREQQSRRMESE